MQFLRDNVFLVGVVAVLVIGVIVLLSMFFIANSDYTAALADREKFGKEVAAAKFKTADPRITSEINARQAAINTMRGDVEKLMSGQDTRYPMLQVFGSDAFPTVNRYRERQAVIAFTEAYVEECHRLLESLGRVEYVTDADFRDQETDERLRIEKIRKDEADEAARQRQANATDPSGSVMPPRPDPGMPMDPRGVVDPRSPIGPAGAPGVRVKTAAEEARENVTARVQLQQAQGGRIYATLASLDCRWDKAAVTQAIDVKQLWEAQVGLWVMQDVVDAINAVNDAAQQAHGDGEPSVLVSAVRELVNITVSPRFVISASSTPGTSGSGRSSSASSAGATAVRANEANRTSPGFTNRGCSKDFDVVHYNFTVVMPPNKLLDLQKALYDLGFHTVLKVDMVPLSASPVSAGGAGSVIRPPTGATGTTQRESRERSPVPLYYGPGSLARVTISGELLLPTAFHRGVFDSKEAKWTRIPRVPFEVLAELKAHAGDAIRPEDDKRISEQNNMQPAAGGTR